MRLLASPLLLRLPFFRSPLSSLFFCLLHLFSLASGFPLPWLASSGVMSLFFFPLPSSYAVAFPAFALRLPLTIFRSFFSLRFLLAASACVVIYALWFLFPLFVSFLALFYVGGLGLCSVLPGHGLCPCSSSAILVHLAYCFSYFLRCFLPCGLYFRPFSSFCSASLRFFFSSTLLPHSDPSSFVTGSPFGPSQLLRWVSSPSSPGLFWIFVR